MDEAAPEAARHGTNKNGRFQLVFVIRNDCGEPKIASLRREAGGEFDEDGKGIAVHSRTLTNDVQNYVPLARVQYSALLHRPLSQELELFYV